MNGARTTSDLHLAWDVPYEPGTLRAVGTKNGQTVATAEISTTGDPAAIELSVDRETIEADRRDVVHVTVKVVDAEGRIHPDADNEIAFEIQGRGTLIGLDNGDMGNSEGYKGTQKKAAHGMCLAIVQSSAKAGQIRVSATSPGLKPGSATVTTKS
jgi:beta-galactosidase